MDNNGLMLIAVFSTGAICMIVAGFLTLVIVGAYLVMADEMRIK